MKVAVIVAVAFAIIAEGEAKVKFNIKNTGGGSLWIGIRVYPGKEHLENGGFTLNKGESKTVYADDRWQGEFWGKTEDCRNKAQCARRSNNPIATYVNISLKEFGGSDSYNVHIVDGYKVSASIEPVDGKGDGGEYSCKKAQNLTNQIYTCKAHTYNINFGQI